MFETKQQLRRTLQFQLYAARAKQLICWTDIKFHIGDIEFTLIIMLHLFDLLLPILAHLLTFRIGTIFFRSHHIWCGYIHITHTGTNYIAVIHRIVLDRSFHIIRILKIQTTWLAIQIIIIIHAQCLYLHRCHDCRIHHHGQRILLLSPQTQRQHAQ